MRKIYSQSDSAKYLSLNYVTSPFLRGFFLIKYSIRFKYRESHVVFVIIIHMTISHDYSSIKRNIFRLKVREIIECYTALASCLMIKLTDLHFCQSLFRKLDDFSKAALHSCQIVQIRRFSLQN